jgi:3D (Asp-Asp-Asp) domain-containing protein
VDIATITTVFVKPNHVYNAIDLKETETFFRTKSCNTNSTTTSYDRTEDMDATTYDNTNSSIGVTTFGSDSTVTVQTTDGISYITVGPSIIQFSKSLSVDSTLKFLDEVSRNWEKTKQGQSSEAPHLKLIDERLGIAKKAIEKSTKVDERVAMRKKIQQVFLTVNSGEHEGIEKKHPFLWDMMINGCVREDKARGLLAALVQATERQEDWREDAVLVDQLIATTEGLDDD